MQRNKKNRKGKDKATNESDFPAVFGVTSQVDFYVFFTMAVIGIFVFSIKVAKGQVSLPSISLNGLDLPLKENLFISASDMRIS